MGKADNTRQNLIPKSVEAEEAVLGSILINPETLDELPWLDASSFWTIRHGWIWDAMQSIRSRRDPIDFLTVVSELEQSGKLSETGGTAYILGLINKTPSSLNVEGYGRIVERMYTRRRLIGCSETIARLAHSDATEIDEVIRRSDDALSDVIIEHLGKSDDVTSTREMAISLLEEAATWRGDPGQMRGMCTGFEPVDKLSRGLRRSKLYYVAARPGVGKSAYLAFLARRFREQGYRVLFYALEMSAMDMTARMACQLTNIKYDSVEDGTLADDEFQRFQDGCLAISDLDIKFSSTAGLTMQEYWDKTRAIEKKYGKFDVVIGDTINCVRGIGDNDTSRMTNCSRTAKLWAHESDYSLIWAVQFNRASEKTGAPPTLGDLRDSGALEEDADVVWSLYRPGMKDRMEPDNKLVAEVLKGRQFGAPVGSRSVFGWQGYCFGIARLEALAQPPEDTQQEFDLL